MVKLLASQHFKSSSCYFSKFIPLAFPGSIPDKEITKQSGYLGMMEPYTELILDKGFNISNESAAKITYVAVSSGK